MPGPDPESLFDAYLDSALRGEAPDPEEWFRGRGGEAGEHLERLVHLRALLDGGGREGPSPLEAERDLPFAQLGDFRLLRRLGEGGMGVVYLAEQEGLGRLAAVKVLRPELAGSPTAAARLEREARAAARLRHPGLVQVLGVGNEAGTPWVAMELVPGSSLAELIAERGPLPPLDAARWGAELARALAAAHAAGVVHRDVKPSNVRVRPEGGAVLVDFGLARDDEQGGPTLTRSFAGSPAYASPEQARGERAAIDHRTDLYSLGATLYEAVSGAPPFEGESVATVLVQVVRDEVRPLRERAPDAPLDFALVVEKAMEREPARRYPTAGALAADLEAVATLRPISVRPPGPLARARRWARRHRRAAAAALVLVLLGVAAAGAALAVTLRADARARAEAGELVREAAELLSVFAERRAEHERASWRARQLTQASQTRWLPPARDAELAAVRVALATYPEDRERTYAEVERRLSQARRLDPDVSGIDAAWAAYHYQRFLDYRTGHENRGIAQHFLDLVRAEDPGGPWAEQAAGEAVLTVDSDPPGAAVYLFRVRPLSDVVPGAPPRLVPCAYGGPEHPAVAPGTPALRVAAPSGPLRRGDLLIELDGEPPRLWRDGGLVDVELPPDLELRPTSAPALWGPDRSLGTTPTAPVPLLPTDYLLLLRREGYEDHRLSFHVDHAVEEYAQDRAFAVALLPEGTTPPSFVYADVHTYDARYDSFWVQEREVTAAEYLAFLNDPAAGATGAHAPTWPGPWRLRDGLWSLPEGIEPDFPALGIPWRGASDYAAWSGERLDAAARGLECALPTRTEWSWAAFGGDARAFPFGATFFPKWCKSRFARFEPGPEPVLSYPLDESVFGAYDLCGSASEWHADAPPDAPAGSRGVSGGAWDLAAAATFQTAAVRHRPEEARDPGQGFRLVLRRAGP